MHLGEIMQFNCQKRLLEKDNNFLFQNYCTKLYWWFFLLIFYTNLFSKPCYDPLKIQMKNKRSIEKNWI